MSTKQITQTGAVGDGLVITSLTGIEKDMQKYLTHEYCYSCAYFSKMRGHFGLCNAGPSSRGFFDGTKKGSGCACWRLRSNLIELSRLNKQEPKLQSDKYKEIREDYNARRKRANTRSVQKLGNWKHKRNFIDEGLPFLYGVPYTETSNILSHRTYYKRHYPKRVIELAFDLLAEGKNYAQAAKEINKRFGTNIAPRTVKEWQQQISKQEKPMAFACRTDPKVLKFVVNMAQKGMTYAALARLVSGTFNISVNPTVVADWIQKYCPNQKPKYLKCKIPVENVELIKEMWNAGLNGHQIKRRLEQDFQIKHTLATIYRVKNLRMQHSQTE